MVGEVVERRHKEEPGQNKKELGQQNTSSTQHNATQHKSLRLIKGLHLLPILNCATMEKRKGE